MIFNMVGGGGTGGASIFIVNSVNQRPTNVFNNTLWVNTDVDAVKCVFSGNEPSNPTEGMLWLIISNSDNVNVAAPINKDWMKFNLGIVRQYIDGAWERKVAQLYKDGIWVDVSRMFSASINITYPANSNCVVTNSGGQTVASDTNTTSSTKTWTATVNATGTYTVTATATDGSGKSKSQSVSITADGQSESVVLDYDIFLFKSGEGAIVQFETARENNSSINITSDAITTNFTANNGYQIACITPKIDLTEFTRLSVVANCTGLGQSTDYAGILGVFAKTATASDLASAKNSDAIVIAKTYFTVKNGEFDLDITGINGEYKVGIKGGLKSTISEIKLRK